MTKIQQVQISKIKAESNDRKMFDETKLAELAASISNHGLAQPITVRPVNQHFEIVAGERRFRAMSLVLGLSEVPCIIRDMTDEEASAIMLAENTGRQDLNPIEEANAYKNRQTRFGWSVDRIAEVAGVSINLVDRRLSLLNLADEVQHLVSFGNLPIGHAELMTKLDINRQRIALRIFQQSTGISKSNFSTIINDLFEEQSQESLFDLENFWTEQVANALPSRGKNASLNVPTRTDLPAIEPTNTDSTSDVVMTFINDLIANGQSEEAAVVGTLFSSLVKKNYLKTK